MGGWVGGSYARTYMPEHDDIRMSNFILQWSVKSNKFANKARRTLIDSRYPGPNLDRLKFGKTIL